MTADWVRLCRRSGFIVDEPHVDVQLDEGRHHRLTVSDRPDAYHMVGLVARQSVVASLPDVPVQAWLRNRTTMLVGFRIDRQGRLIAESWVPKLGLTTEEFQLCLRKLATECDRFEYLLTGRDVE